MVYAGVNMFLNIRHFCIPFGISPFSLRPPQSDNVTSGKSIAESDIHSVPLSAAALPTDCGDWEPERVSDSIHCLEPGSESLKTRKTVFYWR